MFLYSKQYDSIQTWFFRANTNDFMDCFLNDTTINNYCIGIRSINNDYKQQYIIYKKNYPKDNYILLDIIINLLTIITGNIYSNLTKKEKIDLINNNTLLKTVTIRPIATITSTTFQSSLPSEILKSG